MAKPATVEYEKLSDADLYAQMKVVKDQIDACANEAILVGAKQKRLIAELAPLTDAMNAREAKFTESTKGKAKGDIARMVSERSAAKTKALEAMRATASASAAK